MANFDLIEYQRRVISDLMAENKALKDEVQAVKSTYVKIQYHNEELTVREVCERLERAESALKKVKGERDRLIARTKGECWTCIRRYECNSRRGPHKRCWEFDEMLLKEK